MVSPQLGILYCALILVFLMGSSLVLRGRDRGLTSSAARHRNVIRAQLASWSGRRTLLREDRDSDIDAEAVSERFDTPTGVITRARVSIGRLGGFWARIGVSVPFDLPDIPRDVRLLLTEVAIIFVFGAMLFTTRSDWTARPDAPSFPLEPIVTAITTLGSLLWELVSVNPLVGAFPDIVLTITVLTGGALFDEWLFVSLALAVLAGVLWHLQNQISESRPVPDWTIVDDRRDIAVMFAQVVGVAIVSGMLPAGVGVLAERADGGAIVGAFMSLGILLVGFAFAVHGLVERTSRFYESIECRSDADAIVVYELLRRVAAVAGVTAFPLVLGYIGMAIINGRVTSVLGGVVTHPVAIGSLVLAGLLLFRATVPREAIRSLVGRLRAVGKLVGMRVFFFLNAIPKLVLAFLFVVLLVLTEDVVISVAGTITIWTVVRVVWSIAKRIENSNARRRNRPAASASAIAFETGHITDADGDTIHVAVINGRKLAHKNLNRLVEDCLTVIHGLFTDGEYVPTESAGYYNAMTEAGQVDTETVRGRILQKTRGRFETAFRMARNPEISSVDQQASTWGGDYGVLKADEGAVMRFVRQECPDRYIDYVIDEFEDAGVLVRSGNVFHLQSIPENF